MGRARALVLLALAGCADRATPKPSQSPLIGTWRAETYVQLRSGEPPKHPFGQSPRAYLVYDATGHVFFQAVLDARLLDDARGYWRRGDSASLTKLLESGIAYFGTYTLAGGTVVHRIEGELPPNSGTTEIATPYRVSGDTLILGVDTLTHWRFVRVPSR